MRFSEGYSYDVYRNLYFLIKQYNINFSVYATEPSDSLSRPGQEILHVLSCSRGQTHLISQTESCSVGVCSQSPLSTLSPDVCVRATQRKKLSSRVNNTQLPIALQHCRGNVEGLLVKFKEHLAIHTHLGKL